MSVISLVILLAISAFTGSLGMALAGYSRGGCLFSAVFGFVGAFIGMWFARQFGLPELIPITVGGETFPVIWSVVGSAILSLIFGLFSRGRRVF